MQRIVVVLPAPFGPRKPVTLPGSMPNVRSSTAVFSPYRFVRPSTSIMNVALSRVTCGPFWPPATPGRVARSDDFGVLLPGDKAGGEPPRAPLAQAGQA